MESVMYATWFIGFFYLLTFILGFGAMTLLGKEEIQAIDKGGNMAAPMLAEVLGGNILLGFIAAVSFATILAVVAGLTRKEREVRFPAPPSLVGKGAGGLGFSTY